MVIVVKTTGNGDVEKYNDNYFIPVESVEKTITQLSGDGDWHSLHGVRLLVDKSGVIIKGYDEFIGRKFDDVKKLSYVDVFTVMRSIQRTKEITSKSLLLGPNQISKLTSEEKSEVEGIKEKTGKFIDERVKFFKDIEEARLDPILRNKEK